MEQLSPYRSQKPQPLREGEILEILGSGCRDSIAQMIQAYGDRILPHVGRTLRHLLPIKGFDKIEVLAATCEQNGISSIGITAYKVLSAPSARFFKGAAGDLIRTLEVERTYFRSIQNVSCLSIIEKRIANLRIQEEADQEIQRILGTTPAALSRSHLSLPHIHTPIPIRASTPSLEPRRGLQCLEEQKGEK